MSSNLPRRWATLRRLLASWYTPAALGLGLLLTLIRWALPRRIECVVTDATGETRTLTAWDTSRWQALTGVWWQVLLLALVAAGLLAVVWVGRGRVLRAAAAVRFFAASLLLHGLLVLWLCCTPGPCGCRTRRGSPHQSSRRVVRGGCTAGAGERTALLREVGRPETGGGGRAGPWPSGSRPYLCTGRRPARPHHPGARHSHSAAGASAVRAAAAARRCPPTARDRASQCRLPAEAGQGPTRHAAAAAARSRSAGEASPQPLPYPGTPRPGHPRSGRAGVPPSPRPATAATGRPPPGSGRPPSEASDGPGAGRTGRAPAARPLGASGAARTQGRPESRGDANRQAARGRARRCAAADLTANAAPHAGVRRTDGATSAAEASPVITVPALPLRRRRACRPWPSGCRARSPTALARPRLRTRYLRRRRCSCARRRSPALRGAVRRHQGVRGGGRTRSRLAGGSPEPQRQLESEYVPHQLQTPALSRRGDGGLRSGRHRHRPAALPRGRTHPPSGQASADRRPGTAMAGEPAAAGRNLVRPEGRPADVRPRHGLDCPVRSLRHDSGCKTAPASPQGARLCHQGPARPLGRLALPAQPAGRHLRRRLATHGPQKRRDGRAVGPAEGFRGGQTLAGIGGGEASSRRSVRLPVGVSHPDDDGPGLAVLAVSRRRRDDPRMRAGTAYLLGHLPRPGAETSYYWYHATQVMYHVQGKPWKAWNGTLRDLLVSTQNTRGTLAGSWQPTDAASGPAAGSTPRPCGY